MPIQRNTVDIASPEWITQDRVQWNAQLWKKTIPSKNVSVGHVSCLPAFTIDIHKRHKGQLETADKTLYRLYFKKTNFNLRIIQLVLGWAFSLHENWYEEPLWIKNCLDFLVMTKWLMVQLQQSCREEVIFNILCLLRLVVLGNPSNLVILWLC